MDGITGLPAFQASYAPPDEESGGKFLPAPRAKSAAERRIDARARRLVEAIRARAGGLGGIDEFLHAYSLSTKEGLALMVLAEALLRVPDAATADRLIEDKLAAGRWLDGDVKSTALLVSASVWTLGIAARIIHPGETPETILDSIVRRLGLPAMRAATRQAMRLLGSHFVIGQTIEEALRGAHTHAEFRYSFDMLGEGARTDADAENYFGPMPERLPRSAPTARTETGARPVRESRSSSPHCIRATRRSRASACARNSRRASSSSPAWPRRTICQLTVDAEEADRLELSLDVMAPCLPIGRSTAGTDLAWRCRPIRNAPWR